MPNRPAIALHLGPRDVAVAVWIRDEEDVGVYEIKRSSTARFVRRRWRPPPKLDGQRAQVHVKHGRTVHLYSRLGRELLSHAGLAWLRALPWPVDAVVLDAEAVASDGHVGDVISRDPQARRQPDRVVQVPPPTPSSAD